MAEGNELQGLRVLVVEDEFLIADYLAAEIRSFGAEVLGPAASVKQAMALLDIEDVIDVALLDINLRDDKVYPVADALERRAVPILFSSSCDAADMPLAYRHVRRCGKPVSPQRLAAALIQAAAPAA